MLLIRSLQKENIIGTTYFRTFSFYTQIFSLNYLEKLYKHILYTVY